MQATPSVTLSEQIHQLLAERIYLGEWNVGTRLPSEMVLLRQLQVSRNVLREALARLQTQGLIETRHGRGSYVADLTAPREPIGLPLELQNSSEVLLALELRTAIEVEAAGLAALRRTPEQLEQMQQALDAMRSAVLEGQRTRPADRSFHDALAHAAHSPYIEQTLHMLAGTITSRPASDTSELRDQLPTGLRDACAEHQVILCAIEGQDVITAQAAMRLHLINSQARLHAASALEAPR